MNWIDITCLALSLFFGLIGLCRGLLVSVFRLCAWIIALFGALFAKDFIGDFIAKNMALGSFSVNLVCACVGFLVPFLFVTFLGHIFNRFITSTILSKANRLLGGLFGFLKGVIICGVALAILHIIPVSGNFKELRNDAVAYAGFKSCLEAIGYSTDEVDLRNVAEKKASQLTTVITGKAVEKAKETAVQLADSTKKAVQEATLETIKKIADGDSAQAVVASVSSDTAKDTGSTKTSNSSSVTDKRDSGMPVSNSSKKDSKPAK